MGRIISKIRVGESLSNIQRLVTFKGPFRTHPINGNTCVHQDTSKFYFLDFKFLYAKKIGKMFSFMTSQIFEQKRFSFCFSQVTLEKKRRWLQRSTNFIFISYLPEY